MDLNRFSIGFVGLGRMGSALLKGFLAAGLSPNCVTVTDHDTSKISEIVTAFNVESASLKSVVSNTDIIFICIKPQGIQSFLSDVSDVLSPATCLVSILAGIPISTFQSIHINQPVIRVMPNTPVMVSEGVSAYSYSTTVQESYVQYVDYLLASVGMSQHVLESQLDAITGLTGSGPAFVYQLVDTMAKSVLSEGIDYETAVQLVSQTIVGAGKMLQNTSQPPQVLTDNVTSPNGTTAAGLDVFYKSSIQKDLSSVIQAAINRSKELAKES